MQLFFPSKFIEFPDLQPLLHRQKSGRMYTVLEGWGQGDRGEEEKEFLTFSNPVLFDFFTERLYLCITCVKSIV